jgi:STE24 endopeptidase
MVAHRYRLPLALVLTATAAGTATLLLRPRGRLARPAPASAGDYFTPGQLQRAHDFRAPQRMIMLSSLAVETGTVAALTHRPLPIRSTLVAGAALNLTLTAAGLPLAAVSERRMRAYGLSTQNWGAWSSDVAKSSAIGAAFSAAGAGAAAALIRRFPHTWWLPGSAAIVGFSTLMVFLAPVVIDPIFNKFEPLPDGELRSDVLELARQADVDVGEVYRVDASRRTTATNAYVWGIGRTKRVVLYDTLIDDYPDDQVRSVVAHELSHVVHRDVPRGLLWLVIVAPTGTLVVKLLAERLSARSLDTPEALPALSFAAGVVSTVLSALSNVLSRRVEARADAFALDLTKDPDAFIGLTQRLAVTNLADPSTPRIYQLLWGSHPTTVERIGAGLQWASAHSSTAPHGP